MKSLLLILALVMDARAQISLETVPEPPGAPVTKTSLPGAILLIGDSHTAGRFGDGLDRLLRNLEGWEVHTFAVSGSSAWFWAGDASSTKTPSPHTWLHRDPSHPKAAPTGKPEGENTPGPWRLRKIAPAGIKAAVVALGTNHHFLAPKAAAAKTVPLMKELSEAGVSCVWVGPPPLLAEGRRYKIKPGWVDEFYEHLGKAAAENSCVLVDSRKILGVYPETGGDEVHYDRFPEKARQWAEGVFQKVRASLP